jgi:hypothetical protein
MREIVAGDSLEREVLLGPDSSFRVVEAKRVQR